MKIRSDRGRKELDMTSMVDVVFLLLIFFMVTASFSISQCLNQPHANNEDPSPNPIVDEDEDRFVEVVVSEQNTYFVRTDDRESEAPSVRELRSQIRDAKFESGADRLLITAHVAAKHRNVISAWDAGSASGMQQIEMRSTDEDY